MTDLRIASVVGIQHSKAAKVMMYR